MPSVSAAFKRQHRAKLVARLGPSPAVDDPRFLPWSKWHFVGAPGGFTRPRTPAHLTQAEHPGYFEEWARLEMWRQRKRAGVPRPALGLWSHGRLPEWAVIVSRLMDAHGVRPAPPPTPPAPAPHPAPNAQVVARSQKVMVTAWRPLDGVDFDGRLAITADVNVGGNPGQHVEWARQAVKLKHDRGHEACAWANQSQVGIEQLVKFGSTIGADYLMWQAETIGEMTDVGVNPDGSIRPGSPISWGPLVLIGNANAWTGDQRATVTRLVGEGKLGFIQETYTNEGDPWPDAYGTQGVPAFSVCPGVGWGRFPYQLPAYQQHTSPALWKTISPYIPETFDASSRAVMPW